MPQVAALCGTRTVPPSATPGLSASLCVGVSPLTVSEVREAEATDRARDKARRRGDWQAHVSTRPPLAFYGPRLPSYEDALSGLDEAEITLGRIQTLYRPSKQVQEWVQGTLDRHSTEGPRAGTNEFWVQRPTSLFHHENLCA